MEELITQLLSLVKGVWKYRWYSAVIAWVFVLAGGIKVYTLPDDYQASARVFVDTQSILKPLLSGMTTIPNVEQQVSIMSRTLLSRPNLEKVLRMVDLDIKAKTVKDHEQLINNLASQIAITGTGRDDLYTLSYSNENPKLAKEVVQSLLTIFVEGSFGDKKQDTANAVQFIDTQIKSYEEKLVTAENALKDFKLKNSGLLPRQGGDYGTQLSAIEDSLNQAKLELREAEQARNAIKNQIANDEPVDDPKAEQAPLTVSNPEIDGRIEGLQKNLDSLRMQFTERHPDIIATKRLISQLETRKQELEARKREEAKLRKPSGDRGLNYSPMLQQLNVALSEAEARVASMKARVEEYSARSSRLKALSNAIPEVEAQFTRLNRDYEINKSNYDQLVSRREAAKLSGELSNTTEMMTFRVIDPPTVPYTPAGPNRLRLFSMVFIGALVAGIGTALLISQIRPTFLSQSDLRLATGLPILGTVSMNWTDREKTKRKKSLYAFSFSFILLFTLYGGVIANIMLKL